MQGLIRPFVSICAVFASTLPFVTFVSPVQAQTPATPPAQAQTPAKPAEAAEYTGIIIDLRAFAKADRSPSPAIFGPKPEARLLYPDRTCVPTPDEVQEQSIVRYYCTEEAARKGIAGNNPLIIKATALIGPACDSAEVSADDAKRLLEVDKSIHYTRTWKVAFLLPEGK